MLSLKLRNLLSITILALLTSGLAAKIKLMNGDDICLVGAGMGSRMIHYGHFETEIYLRHPSLNLKSEIYVTKETLPAFAHTPAGIRKSSTLFPEQRNSFTMT